jgi:hypothetical protein
MLVARKWEKKVKKNQTTDKRKMDWKALQNSVNFILNSFRSNLCFIKFMLYLEHLNISLVVWTWWLIEKKMVQIFEYHVHMMWKV